VYDGELCDMVSAALRVTETPGSCRIHSDEYDVNKDAGGEDDSEYDVARMISIQSAKPLLTLAFTQGSACSSLLRRPFFSSPFTSS